MTERHATVAAKLLVRQLLATGTLLLAGCYSYVGVGDVAPAEGADVRVDLPFPRDVTLQDVTVHGITRLQGRLLRADDDSMALAVIRLWGTDDRTFDASHVGVLLPRSAVAALQEKRLSPVRSGLAIIAGGAGVVAVIFSVGQLVGSSGGTPPKPQP